MMVILQKKFHRLDEWNNEAEWDDMFEQMKNRKV